MKRKLEPELMEDRVQAKAYAAANIDTHHRIVQRIDNVFGKLNISGEILDLGCGPGGATFQIARRFPNALVTAIDGALAMLSLAEERKEQEPEVGNRIDFIQAMVPSTDIPQKPYDLIFSTLFLHHLHQPDLLWQTIINLSQPGTKVFLADLKRPDSNSAARWLVNEMARNEPAVFKDDLYHSLLAAYTPEEVEAQLYKAGLQKLSIDVGTYIVIHGEMT